MFNSKQKQLTEPARIFLEPANPTHRQYEALRAYFVEGLPSHEVAKRFGYTPGSFRVLCHQFRHNPQRPFFILPQTGPHRAPKRDLVRDQVIALRKQNLSIYDMSLPPSPISRTCLSVPWPSPTSSATRALLASHAGPTRNRPTDTLWPYPGGHRRCPPTRAGTPRTPAHAVRRPVPLLALSWPKSCR